MTNNETARRNEPADLRAELNEWRRRAEVAEAVPAERAGTLAEIRALLDAITAKETGVAEPSWLLTSDPIIIGENRHTRE